MKNTGDGDGDGDEEDLQPLIHHYDDACDIDDLDLILISARGMAGRHKVAQRGQS